MQPLPALYLAAFTLAASIATRPALAAEPTPAVVAAVVDTPPGEIAPAAPAEPPPHFALAVFTEGALGFSGAGFYNQLSGLRLDYRTGRHLTLGLGASYANMKGPDGRAHNTLFAAMLEWNAPVSKQVGIPIRFVTGYLPKNGPWLKAAAGLSYQLSERTRLTFEALAPALWIVKDSTVGSMDAALEIAVAL